MKKILVIINKNWETEPVLNALTHSKLRPKELPFPLLINTPHDGNNRMSEPRALLLLNENGKEPVKVIIRCIEDLMAPHVNTSNSLEKYKVLPSVISEDAAQLIISVSTANHPDQAASHNGCVIVGGNFFIYDGASPGMPSDERLTHPDIGKLLPPNVNPELFMLINDAFNTTVVPKFMLPRNSPATRLLCESSKSYSAVSSVNVTDYAAYDTLDKKALEAFKKVAGESCTAASIETTHGVVKISTTQEPLLFLSPITDRLGHFDEDVTDTQNYIAAFNGGLALGQLLCELARFAESGKQFGLK